MIPSFHLYTWAAMFLVGSSLIIRNLLGVPDGWLCHGWPFTYMERSISWNFYGLQNLPYPHPTLTAESRWPFDDTEILSFHYSALLANVVIAVLMLYGVVRFTQQLCVYWKFKNQFGVRTMFGMMGVSAIAFMIRRWYFFDWTILLWKPIGYGLLATSLVVLRVKWKMVVPESQGVS